MKRKTHFTRKNLIFQSLLFFYLLVVFGSGFICDANNGIIQKNSPLKKLLIGALHLPSISAEMDGWIILGLFVVFTFILSGALIFESRLARFYEKKIFTTKWSTIYGASAGVFVGLWIGLSFLAQVHNSVEEIANNFAFFGESLLVGTILFLLVALPILFLVMLIVNFKNIDKPFRFSKGEEEEDIDDEESTDKVIGKAGAVEANSLVSALGSGSGVSPLSELTDNLDDDDEKEEEEKSPSLGSKEYVFPGLCTIDEEEQSRTPSVVPSTSLSLAEIVADFRKYLAKKEGLYFSLATLRSFLAGMAASRLLILEGLSGTGKSSLARYFSEYIGEESFFEPVQASWRDRTSLLGFFNDFAHRYDETDFLKRLYQRTYRPDDINIMVLDEINISRVEYYFADFLSIMEYPLDQWKLRILQVPYDFEGPEHLPSGVLAIPESTWFIGTANKDDSTYTITDKVYDRAITISFDERNVPFEVTEDVHPIHLSYSGLNRLFAEALADEKKRLSKADLEKFFQLTGFVSDTFDITFGNRVLNQMEILVPVYVACGGSKEDALDFLFARKVLCKLEGRFEDYVRQGLLDLANLLDEIYGKEAFPLTRRNIQKMIKRL